MKAVFCFHRSLALFLSLSLAVPAPAFALRTESPIDAGLEEDLAEALAASPTAPAAGLEEWTELAFHLKRIESAEAAPESKTQAVDAILGIGLRDGKIPPQQVPSLVERLILPYRSEPDPGVKAALLELLAYAGFDHPKVPSLFSERLKEPANDPVLSRGIQGLGLRRFDNPDSPSVRAHQMDWLSVLFPILSRGISIEAGNFLQFLSEALESAKPGSPENSAMRKELSQPKWLDPLRDLYEESQSSEGIHRPAGEILWRLGQQIQPEDRELFERLKKSLQSDSVEEMARSLEIHLRQRQRIPLEHPLSPEEINRLKDQVAQHGRLPSVLLEELFFEENRQIVFINRESRGEAEFEERKGILADLRYLADLEAAPILLALPLPRGMESDLESFLKDGRLSPPLWKSFAGLLFLKEEITDVWERELVEEVIRSWRSLRTLPGAVRLALYGAELGISGENRFDSMTFNLKDILKKNQKARIVVYDDPSFNFPGSVFSKRDLTGEDRSVSRSLALALAQEGMPEKIASVIEQTEAGWENDEEDERLHNLVELARAVPTSFGIRLKEINLQAVRFDTAWLETYHPEVWDALILRRKDDRRDPEFFLPPELPEPQILEPSPAPAGAVPLVTAGLEEEGKVDGRTIRALFESVDKLLLDKSKARLMLPQGRTFLTSFRDTYRRTRGRMPIEKQNSTSPAWSKASHDKVREVYQRVLQQLAPLETQLPLAAGPSTELRTDLVEADAVLAGLEQRVQGPGVVVLEEGVLRGRAGFREFAARAGKEVARRMVLVGLEEDEAARLKERNPSIHLIPAGDLISLAALLVGLEEADRITHIGETSALAEQLDRLLPASMEVIHLDAAAGLEQILLALGVADSFLRTIDAAGLEESLSRLARERAT